MDLIKPETWYDTYLIEANRATGGTIGRQSTDDYAWNNATPYTNTATYSVGAKVTSSVSGRPRTYTCIQAHAPSHAVTDTTYWTNTSAAYEDWSISQAYAVGDTVIHVSAVDGVTKTRRYECLLANTGYAPYLYTSGATPKWLDIGASNEFAMFDDKWGTRTVGLGRGSVDYGLRVDMKLPGRQPDSLAALNVVGQAITLTMYDTTALGTVTYTTEISLVSDVGIFDWSTYFFEDIVSESDVIFRNLPRSSAQVFRLDLTGQTGNKVGIGGVSFGKYYELGNLQASPTVGIVDYSLKTTDAYGNISVTRRAYSKRFTARFTILNDAVDRIANILATVRSTPVVWIGSGNDYSSLVVWGFYKDFEIEIAYPIMSYCSLTIEGLV